MWVRRFEYVDLEVLLINNIELSTTITIYSVLYSIDFHILKVNIFNFINFINIEVQFVIFILFIKVVIENSINQA